MSQGRAVADRAPAVIPMDYNCPPNEVPSGPGGVCEIPSPAPSAAPCVVDPQTGKDNPPGCMSANVPGWMKALDGQLAISCDVLASSGHPLNGIATTFQAIYDVVTLKEMSAGLGVAVGHLAINVLGILFALSLFAVFAELRKNARNSSLRNFLVLPATKIFFYFMIVITINVLSGIGVTNGAGPPPSSGGGTLAASLPDSGMSLARTLFQSPPVMQTMASAWNITPIPVPTGVGTIASDGICSAYKGFLFPLDMGGRVAESSISSGWFQPLVDLVVAVLFEIATLIPQAAQVLAFVILFFERVVLGVNGSVIAALGLLTLATLALPVARSYGENYFKSLVQLYVSGLVLGAFLWLTLNLNLLAENIMLGQLGPSHTLNFGDGAIYIAIFWFLAALMLAFAFSVKPSVNQILSGQLGMSGGAMLTGLAGVAGLAAGAGALLKGLLSGQKDAVKPDSSSSSNDPSSTSGTQPSGPSPTASPRSSNESADRGIDSRAQSPAEVPPATGRNDRGDRDADRAPETYRSDRSAEPMPAARDEDSRSDRDAQRDNAAREVAAQKQRAHDRDADDEHDAPESSLQEQLTRDAAARAIAPEERAGEAERVAATLGESAVAAAAARKAALPQQALRDKLQSRIENSTVGLVGRQAGQATVRAVKASASIAKRAAHGLRSSSFIRSAATTLHHGTQGQHMHFGHHFGPSSQRWAPNGPPPDAVSFAGGAQNYRPDSLESDTARSEASGALSLIGSRSTDIPPATSTAVTAAIREGTRALNAGNAPQAATALLGAAAIATIGARESGPGADALDMAGKRLTVAARNVGAPRATPTIARLSGDAARIPRVARLSGPSAIQATLQHAHALLPQLTPSANAAGLRAAAALDVAFDLATTRGADGGALSSGVAQARSLAAAAAEQDPANAAVWRSIAEQLRPPPVAPAEPEPEPSTPGV